MKSDENMKGCESLIPDGPSIVGLPLRDALQATWDDAWNLVHDRRQPSMEEAAALETRFQDLLDEIDGREQRAWAKGVRDSEEARAFAKDLDTRRRNANRAYMPAIDKLSKYRRDRT